MILFALMTPEPTAHMDLSLCHDDRYGALICPVEAFDIYGYQRVVRQES